MALSSLLTCSVASGLRRRAAARSRRVMAVLLTVASLCAAGASCRSDREAKLQEVLRRSGVAPERIVEAESPFLTDEDPDVRALAVWAIGYARAPNAVEILAPLAADPDSSVRLALARALCGLEEAGALDPVASLITDRDPSTRLAALRCLVGRGSPSTEVLASSLVDSDKEVRTTALAWLVNHPDAALTPQLLRFLQSGSLDEQLAGVSALRASRDPSALPELEKLAAARLPIALRDVVESTIVELRAAQREQEQAAQAEGEPHEPIVDTAPRPRGRRATPRPAGEPAPESSTSADSTTESPVEGAQPR